MVKDNAAFNSLGQTARLFSVSVKANPVDVSSPAVEAVKLTSILLTSSF